jgi:RNA polymerase sigma factor (sigma-70 family)
MNYIINESYLLAGIRQRDDSCFVHLYSICYPAVHKFVSTSGGTIEDVKDLLQDSLVVLYENTISGKFREESTLSTYLQSICHNRWYLYLRQKKHVLIDNYSKFINLTDIESQDDNFGERAAYAESLLSNTSDRCREILLAYYYDNLSMEQVALKLGYTNADNAKNQKSRCMDKLRKAVSSVNQTKS